MTVLPLIPIALPFGLKHDELNIDSPRSRTVSLRQSLQFMEMEVDTEEEAELIFRGAVVLYHSLAGVESFAACLDTAIIWSRG
jgi:hypothetical protein